ncbi:MAG: soluble lytic murein transglycosylase [Nevskia sp.]|nr:soluble lytic murein transglycosylase [Nevskia sp.]
MTPLMSFSTRALSLTLACVLGTTAAAPAAIVDDDALAASREVFRSAYAAAANGTAAGSDSAALKAYPLYAYLQAARIQWNLSRPPSQVAPETDERAAALLKSLGEQPLARDLRRAWLGSLAARRDWARFVAEYRDNVNDTTLRCTQLSARAQLERTQGLAADITQQWLNGQNTPDACEPAFAWLRVHDGLPPSLIDQRARLALAAGNSKLARKLAATLSPELAAPITQWITLIDNPRSEIDLLIAAPARPVEPAALLDGWQRLTRSDPQGAAPLYQPLLVARQLTTPADYAAYARALALGLAWSRLPQAGGYFALMTPDASDDLAREWQVRAALWAGDWATANAVIAAMPQATLAAQPRWQYFLARSREKTGDTDSAQKLYAQLAATDGFYAALAAARLGQSYAPHPQLLPQNATLQAQLAAHPALLRAHELWLLGMKPQAGAEWQYAFEALDPAARTQAAALALRWGWYDQGVAAASRQGIYYDYALLYPRPFDVQVHAAAVLASLPDDFIYAILRQESLYDASAVSRAGALGLLQLVPDTARATARRWQQPPPTRDALFDPSVNLNIGSAELRDRLNQFGGELPVAIASYNAGPNAAARWLPPTPMDTDIWIENIPYNETRTYVQRVLWHRLVFGWRHSGEPQDPKDWLLPVTPLTVNPDDAP